MCKTCCQMFKIIALMLWCVFHVICVGILDHVCTVLCCAARRWRAVLSIFYFIRRCERQHGFGFLRTESGRTTARNTTKVSLKKRNVDPPFVMSDPELAPGSQQPPDPATDPVPVPCSCFVFAFVFSSWPPVAVHAPAPDSCTAAYGTCSRTCSCMRDRWPLAPSILYPYLSFPCHQGN